VTIRVLLGMILFLFGPWRLNLRKIPLWEVYFPKLSHICICILISHTFRSNVGFNMSSLNQSPMHSYQFPTLQFIPLLAQEQTQGSTLQHRTNKTLTIVPFGNTCEAREISPEVEAGGLHDLGVCNQAGT
jgi:hypothetical protein